MNDLARSMRIVQISYTEFKVELVVEGSSHFCLMYIHHSGGSGSIALRVEE